MNKIVENILSQYECTKIDIGEFEKMKVGPITFDIICYDVKNIGRVSYMYGKALCGLMKMETLMITPFFNDSCLFSYDEIKVLKNDTFIVEMYNTCSSKRKYENLLNIKEKYKHFKKYNLEKRWYDALRCEESISFKEKGKNLFDNLLNDYVSTFLDNIKNDKPISIDEKKKLHNQYVDRLVNEGGTSTDAFIKAIGKEKTDLLFKKYLFGIDD